METAVEKKLDLSDAKALHKHRFDAAVRGLQKRFEIEDGDISSLISTNSIRTSSSWRS